MRRNLLAAILLLGACSSSDGDRIVLTESEALALQENFECAFDTQGSLAALVFAAARGDLPALTGWTYDPPTAANQWVGTLTRTGAFPFGTGELTIQFTATGDSGPVDPYAVDIRDDLQVGIDVHSLSFDGVDPEGAALVVAGAFGYTTLANAAALATAAFAGDVTVGCGAYEVDLSTTDLSLELDMVEEEVTSVTGMIDGTIDIPDLGVDADVDAQGLGTSVDVAIDVAGFSIDYLLDLADV